MRAGNLDIVVETGARWSRSAQLLAPADPVPASTAVPGSRYFVDGWPLRLHANQPASGSRVKLVFGQGTYADVSLTVDATAGISPAVPLIVLEVAAAFTVDDPDPDTGDPVASRVPVPAVVAPDGLTVTLTMDEAQTAALAPREGAYSWDMYTRTVEWDWQRVLEGTLTIVKGDTR